ncbi:hypothetical protein VTJ83DRAFT_4573 [Remersonia thermophila]|uniref:Integral membrane protein n=1 Tax=Remersonia thermophila TaxID=72144 RepID=A0ABR4DAB7_9PEZI
MVDIKISYYYGGNPNPDPGPPNTSGHPPSGAQHPSGQQPAPYPPPSGSYPQQAPGHAQEHYPPPPGQHQQTSPLPPYQPSLAFPPPPVQSQEPPPLPPRQPSPAFPPPPGQHYQPPPLPPRPLSSAFASLPSSSEVLSDFKSRLGGTVAGFQSKLGSYMAKMQTPPPTAYYPGGPSQQATSGGGALPSYQHQPQDLPTASQQPVHPLPAGNTQTAQGAEPQAAGPVHFSSTWSPVPSTSQHACPPPPPPPPQFPQYQPLLPLESSHQAQGSPTTLPARSETHSLDSVPPPPEKNAQAAHGSEPEFSSSSSFSSHPAASTASLNQGSGDQGRPGPLSASEPAPGEKNETRPPVPEKVPEAQATAEEPPSHGPDSSRSAFSMGSLASEIERLLPSAPAADAASALPRISTNPYPATGEIVVTDYFLHPMMVAPFSSTPQTRICMGHFPHVGRRTVYFHPSAPEFSICAFCYGAYLAPSAFAASFEAKTAEKARCGFHVPRITRSLWPAACATGDLAPLVEYMRRRSSGAMSFCGGPEAKPASASIRWFAARDRLALPASEFALCEACFEDLVGEGPWRARFEAAPGAQPKDESWMCDGWHQPYVRHILQGDWARFVEHVKRWRALPPCDGQWKGPEARWWTLRACDRIFVCEPCYLGKFAASRWEGIVEPGVAAALDSGGRWACDWHNSHNRNLGMALRYAEILKLGAEDLSRRLALIVTKPACGNPEGLVDGLYYNVRDAPIANFGICEACYESCIVLSGLAGFFTDRPSMVPGNTYCNFHPKVHWAACSDQWLIEALQSGVWAAYEDKARALSTTPPCTGIHAAKGGQWWGWPDCTICPWHYHSVAAGSRFASEMPLQGLVGVPDEARICSLFSDGQQRRYREACETGDLDGFLAFCRERYEKWAVMWPAIQRLQAVISNTYWKAVNLRIQSNSNRTSDAITFGTPSATYISSSGNRYNSHSGILAEQQAAEADVLFRQSTEPRVQQAMLIEEWNKWE